MHYTVPSSIAPPCLESCNYWKFYAMKSNTSKARASASLKLLLLAALVLAQCCSTTASWLSGKITPDHQCEVQRDDAFHCAVNYADLDGDQRVSKPEVIYFRNFVLHWYEKALVWVVHETPEKIMQRCAAAPDKQYITEASYRAATTECLRHCKDWRLAMAMCKRMEEKSEQERAEHRHHFKKWLRDYERKQKRH